MSRTPASAPSVSRRRHHRTHPLAVALAVLGAAVIVTYLAFNHGLPLVHRFTLRATVANSVNVRGGDPVRIAGIDVGNVVGVSPHGDESTIEFTLGADALPIHRDATLRVRDRLFLEGSYYLELDPGTPGSPVLPDGGVIPAAQTTSPVQFWQVLSLFDQPTRSALTSSLEALHEGFGAAGARGLKAAAPEFQPVESDLSRIDRGLGGTAPGDLGALLRSTAAVSGTLAQSSSQLGDLVSGLNATAGALASSDGSLARSITGLDQTLAATPPALVALDRALPPVSRLARALDPSLLISPPLLDGLITTAGQLAAVLAPGERGPLIASLKATFEQLPAILTQLASSFPVGRQVTDCLRTHVLPVLHQSVPDGSLSSGQSVLLDFLHFLPGLAGASASFDGDGPYTRFVTGGGSNTLSGILEGQPLVSTGTPGGAPLQGARPQWVGDLVPADFRPDASCASQKIPSLASPTAPPDLVPKGTP